MQLRADLRKHKDLIDELDQLFPLRNFSPTDTLDRIRYNSGQREVVELLKRELADQEKQSNSLSIQVLGTDSDDVFQ